MWFHWRFANVCDICLGAVGSNCIVRGVDERADFESLTSNQQGVIERLIRQRQQDKSNQRVEVELVDVQI